MLGSTLVFHRPLAAKTFSKLIAYAWQSEYFDVRLSIAGDGGLAVDYQNNGATAEQLSFSADLAQAVCQYCRHLAGLNAKQTAGVFTLTLPAGQLRIVATAVKTAAGEIISLRLSNASTEPLYLDELGLSDSRWSTVYENLYRPGLMVINSPAGHGKTTTALACVLAGNAENFNVYTVSHAALTPLDGVNQIVIKKNTARGWQTAANALIKQDPDIIFLDQPPADFDASVLAPWSLSKIIIVSLEAPSAWSAAQQLLLSGLNAGGAEAKFNLLINQRLVRRLCPDCAFPYNLDTPTFAELARDFDILDQDLIGLQLWHAQGCAACRHQGYQDRLGLFEVIAAGPNFSRLLTAPDAPALLEQQLDLSLAEDGFIKALQGLTTVEELKTAFKRL